MSQWFKTFFRKSYYFSRSTNSDRSQSFRIYILICAIYIATLHAMGHLSGIFSFGLGANREDAVAALLGLDAVPRPYMAYSQLLSSKRRDGESEFVLACP